MQKRKMYSIERLLWSDYFESRHYRFGSQGDHQPVVVTLVPKALRQTFCTPEADVHNRSGGRFRLQMIAVHLGGSIPPGAAAR